MHKPKYQLRGNQLQPSFTVHRQRTGTRNFKPKHHQGNKLNPDLLRLPFGNQNYQTERNKTDKNQAKHKESNPGNPDPAAA